MRTKYPARSRESDLAARLVNVRLTQLAAAGESDFMVTVVVSRSERAFVGFSGTHRELAARLAAELSKEIGEAIGDHVVKKAKLSPEEAGWARKTRLTVSRWSREYEWLGNYIVLADRKYHHLSEAGQVLLFRGFLNESRNPTGSPLTDSDREELARERAIRERGIGVGEAAKAAAKAGSQRMVMKAAPRMAVNTEQTPEQMKISASTQDMVKRQHAAQRKVQHPPEQAAEQGMVQQQDAAPGRGALHGFNWNCSEPKALFDSVVHGDGIQGMTTFWFGNPGHEAVTKYGVADTTQDAGGRGLRLCKPCDRCSEFEVFIMAAVSRTEDRVRRMNAGDRDQMRRVKMPLESPW